MYNLCDETPQPDEQNQLFDWPLPANHSFFCHYTCSVYSVCTMRYEIYTCLLSSTAYFSPLQQLTQLITSQSHSNTDSEPRSQASVYQFVTTITLHRKAQTITSPQTRGKFCSFLFLATGQLHVLIKHCHLVVTVVKFYTFHYI